MSERSKKWLMFTVRWGIAVVGIAYVIYNLSWEDRVWAILDASNVPRQAALVAQRGHEYTVYDPVKRDYRQLDKASVVNEPDRKNLMVTVDGAQRKLLGLDLNDALNPRDLRVNRLLVAVDPQATRGQWLLPEAVSNYHLEVPHPRVEVGVIHMVRYADVKLLLAALVIFPLTYLITAYRWHELLKVLDVRLPQARTFVLNMVGAFYNTFMPGSTGGDVLKAYYVAKQTHHRTRAVMSVLVDRIIGLVALVILGGAMALWAALKWGIPQTAQVAFASAAILVCTAIGAIIFYVPILRKASGFDFLAGKLPMQRQVAAAIDTLHMYGRRPLLLLWTLLVSFPVHTVVIVTALLCGLAFGLHIPWYFYFTAVPVIVLAGSIPISPQGAGVMEFFAIKLTAPLGATVGEAFALTMSIRLLAILWNLTGGFFVLRGGYHAPTQAEQQEVEAEDEDENTAATPAPVG